ncbi:MAG: aminopeptidase P family protein [Oscillospiraceae bacterium]|jgi:Xaa-Pro aminopeptidase|nr:aminopeptidase P family protein [Oscillospiraceae bacterium]
MGHPIKALAQTLPESTAAWISSPVSCRYLSGFAADNCAVLLSSAGAFYLTDKRYLEAVEKCVTALEVRDIEKLDELLKTLPETEFSIDAEYVTLAQLARREKKCPALRFCTDGTLDKTLAEMRAVKSDAEVAHIRAAQDIAERALAQILPEIRPGRTETEIARALEWAMFALGAQGISFDTIAVAGENGSLPHGVPGGRPLRSGDLLTLDFGAVVGGYHSDMTRTVAVGEISDEQREIYALVLKAQRAGIAAVKPGAACKDIDAACRVVFEQAGMGKYFAHSTGHGVGLEIHESPTLSKKSEDTLQAGMVVTVEPGLYLPGRFGVRIEDMVLVTKTGGENLTGYTKELLAL